MNTGLKNNTDRIRIVRRTICLLRKVWMKIRLEKVNTYKKVTVKALLDSGTTRMFADREFVERNRFKKEKLVRPIEVRNVNGTNNSGGKIEEEIKCNMYFEGHIERVRMKICDLGRTEVILGILWLAVHNLEIDWEKEKVWMTRCPPLCRRNKKQEKKKRKLVVKGAKRVVEELVLKRFWKWRKMFGKAQSERIPTRKLWDHAIKLKKDFVS